MIVETRDRNYATPNPVLVGVADVESEGPSRAAGGGLVDRFWGLL